MSKGILDEFMGNIYYSETLKSLYIVISDLNNYTVEIKLLNRPEFRGNNKNLPLGHATTSLYKLKERKPVSKMNILQIIELFIVPKS